MKSLWICWVRLDQVLSVGLLEWLSQFVSTVDVYTGEVAWRTWVVLGLWCGTRRYYKDLCTSRGFPMRRGDHMALDRW